ncbi:hypothetical protein, partial [Legionella pneumophila]|uniref:hypothetical protein n=1 Tax=Legionella pneumophila TaxID=446 RepID=UPI0005CB7B6A
PPGLICCCYRPEAGQISQERSRLRAEERVKLTTTTTTIEMREFKTIGDNPTGCLLQLWEQDFLLINCRLIFIKNWKLKECLMLTF